MQDKKNPLELSPDELYKIIADKLKIVKDFNLFEQVAYFLGRAQLVELALRNILINQYNYSEQTVEKYTLGRSISDLEKNGLRKDFIHILKELNKYRVYIAHNILSDFALLNNLVDGAGRLVEKNIRHVLFQVVYVTQVYDFLMENDFLFTNSPQTQI